MTPSSQRLIGLTGGIATGKSNLAQALRKAGAQVIDADQLARELTAPGGAALPLLREAFGEAVFEGQELNRRALGAMVFADPDKLQRLNAIMHPMLASRMLAKAEALRDGGPVILEAALLFEAGWDRYCAETWCAWVPPCVQLRRVMRRDGLDAEAARQRIQSQMPLREKLRRADRRILTLFSKRFSASKAIRLWRDFGRREHAARTA